MKKIVVPVDFSDASSNAVDYAAELAVSVQAGLVLVYVCQFLVNVSEVPVSSQLIDDMLDDAEQDMAKLQQRLALAWGDRLQTETVISKGYVVYQLQELCNSVKPIAVVMGAHGTGATERALFGSTTLSAIRQLSWPLIIVPKDAHFKNTGKIGLACDLRDVAASVHVNQIKALVKALNATLYVLHADTGKERVVSTANNEAASWLRQTLEEVTPVFHFIDKDNVEEAINQFAEKNDLDMLIVIPKKHGILEGIFHRSNAKKIVLQAHVPVLSIHE